MPIVNITTAQDKQPLTFTVAAEIADEWAAQLGDPDGVLKHTSDNKVTHIPVRQITCLLVTDNYDPGNDIH